jgi:hypothetical protein
VGALDCSVMALAVPIVVRTITVVFVDTNWLAGSMELSEMNSGSGSDSNTVETEVLVGVAHPFSNGLPISGSRPVWGVTKATVTGSVFDSGRGLSRGRSDIYLTAWARRANRPGARMASSW